MVLGQGVFLLSIYSSGYWALLFEIKHLHHG